MAAKDKEIEDLKRRVIEVNFTCSFYILSNPIKTKKNMHDDFYRFKDSMRKSMGRNWKTYRRLK